MWSFSICTFSSRIFCVACVLQQSRQNIYILKIKMNLHPLFVSVWLHSNTSRWFWEQTRSSTHQTDTLTLIPLLSNYKKAASTVNPDGCMRCKRIFIYKLFEKDVFVGYLTPSPVINIDKLTAFISVTWTHHRSHAAAILTAVSHTELNKEKLIEW